MLKQIYKQKPSLCFAVYATVYQNKSILHREHLAIVLGKKELCFTLNPCHSITHHKGKHKKKSKKLKILWCLPKTKPDRTYSLIHHNPIILSFDNYKTRQNHPFHYYKALNCSCKVNHTMCWVCSSHWNRNILEVWNILWKLNRNKTPWN